LHLNQVLPGGIVPAINGVRMVGHAAILPDSIGGRGGAILIPDTIQPGAFTMTPEDRYTAIARECVRLAELTDNQDLRSHLQAVALDLMAEAVAERDDHSNVIEFPRRA
jgi:hypothetical protein